ncbi:hypothetical protein FE697_001895 [Mumia zhuanghuii]|uniref:VanZ like family protein n=2 Tax=Mumia TaxID=1546255 RepID=A0ABW1QHN0_9ACTN|nr:MULTISPECIES: hypothetical protein [Mumia]KAA1424700.1 hypothetical protein FE697_001895 [Mumia zhuanghuii]
MLDSYFRETPMAGVGIVVALSVATALAAASVRTAYAAPVRVWVYVAGLGTFVAVTMLPDSLSHGWHWRSPLDLSLAEPRWDAFVTGVDSATLNVWLGLPLGIGAVLLALDRHRWWPVVVAVLAPCVAEWWQAVMPSGRHGMSGEDLANNLVGIGVGAVVGVLLHLALVRAERRWGSDAGASRAGESTGPGSDDV